VRFFIDNNLSTKLAKSLHFLVEPDHQVVHLKDRFAANTPDETWMAVLAGEPDWIIISGDLRIRKNPHEIHAWKAAGHTTFFLKAGWINLPFWNPDLEVREMLPGYRRHCYTREEWNLLHGIYDGGDRGIIGGIESFRVFVSHPIRQRTDSPWRKTYWQTRTASSNLLP
jgi:PIN like domain